MSPELPRLEWPSGRTLDEALGDEWLLTNGLGGYAGASIAWANTRKYHGLLNAALPTRGRTSLVPMLEETLELGPNQSVRLGAQELAPSTVDPGAFGALVRFSLNGLIPEWEYALSGRRLVRSVVMVHGANTVCVRYRLLEGPSVALRLRPFLEDRSHDGPLRKEPRHFEATVEGGAVTVRLASELPSLRLLSNASWASLPVTSGLLHYRLEANRGYDATELLSSPGTFAATLSTENEVFLTLSFEPEVPPPERLFADELSRERSLLERAGAPREPVRARLTLAADQFLVHPGYREGATQTSIIAGYPWFTDWGRDSMISLEGLTACTGRVSESAAILRTFRGAVRDGLVPNFFPDGQDEGVYHTADATLWFFQALHRHLELTDDHALLEESWPTLVEIIDAHRRGTRFNIGVDERDGLLTQGAAGYQLTWMDAKVDDWVVTPRRGKTVELNALWFNAVSLMAQWARQLGHDASPYSSLAARTRSAFNARFWNPTRECLFDVIDGETGVADPAVRPNQLFAISLAHPVLAQERWASVLQVVKRELLTPVGVRTLSRDHADYRATYDGDLRARDAAYHQGTVWPWLLGHFLDASLKAGLPVSAGRTYLEGLTLHLQEAGVGTVSEIFDATAPFHPRGCFAQAWSVAELLRAWAALDRRSPPARGST